MSKKSCTMETWTRILNMSLNAIARENHGVSVYVAVKNIHAEMLLRPYPDNKTLLENVDMYGPSAKNPIVQSVLYNQQYKGDRYWHQPIDQHLVMIVKHSCINYFKTTMYIGRCSSRGNTKLHCVVTSYASSLMTFVVWWANTFAGSPATSNTESVGFFASLMV